MDVPHGSVSGAVATPAWALLGDIKRNTHRLQSLQKAAGREPRIRMIEHPAFRGHRGFGAAEKFRLMPGKSTAS